MIHYKNIPKIFRKILVINMAFYCYEAQWHASGLPHACACLLLLLKKGKIIRNERRRRMFNYQYFWNIFGIFYKCILGIKQAQQNSPRGHTFFARFFFHKSQRNEKLQNQLVNFRLGVIFSYARINQTSTLIFAKFLVLLQIR